MRFHHLSVTAFGPFAGTEVVDFDELNDAGIFLLTGPTGAGKTSVLDAICFALYGVVPGERGVKALRSHHAPPEARPRVVLEVTLGTRRFRVERSPEWHRPKKRGQGTTREHASASLLELTDGHERLVSSRIQEVGHELGAVLGMTSEQFMQVVMLPQGEFQTFLRASSDERQGVLERLFQTGRFARVEEWMRDRTKELSLAASAGERQVGQLLATLADRSGVPLPEALAADRLGDVAPTARAWATTMVAQARHSRETARAAEASALAALEQAEVDAREAVRQAAVLRRRREAEAVLAQLRDTEPTAAERAATLASHERALLVQPYLEPLSGVEEELRHARDRRALVIARLDELPEALRPERRDAAGCEAARAAIGDRIGLLRAVLPREQSLRVTEVELATARDECDRLDEVLDALAGSAAQLPDRRAVLTQRVAAAQQAATGREAARTALTQAKAREAAATALPAARSRHHDLRSRSSTARDRAVDARERHLDLVERRLAGMAAELAGTLVDGQECQVCGSTAHPHKAAARSDAVTVDQQRRAEADHERLRQAADLLADEADEAGRIVAGLEALSEGLPPAAAAAQLDACRAALVAAEQAGDALPELLEHLSAVETEAQDLAARIEDARTSRAARGADVSSLESAVAVVRRELARALAGHDGTVAEVIAVHQEAAAVLREAAESDGVCARATRRAAEAADLATGAALQHGFASTAAAREALLGEEAVDELRTTLRLRAERRAGAAAVLEEREVRDCGDQAVDPVAAQALLAGVKELARARAVAAGSLDQSCTALERLVAQLECALEAWEPARTEHETADALSRLVRGMGGDNHLQMRLSSYVLTRRLDQVLEAANERLAQMRDQRYSLSRTGRARGVTRAGLGLELHDAWTDEPRDPCTLSGGETFVVSLALALGLADVVAQETGGLRVETLFIDEGFGMLDPDTLDDVMDRIDALRAGGRTVGVVSHVPELRGRIPTQLHVTRTPQGSTVAVRTLVA